VKAQIGSIRHPFCWKVEQCVSDLKAYNYICTNKLKSVRLCVSCACIEGGMPLAVWWCLMSLGLTSSRWNKASFTRTITAQWAFGPCLQKPSHQTGSNQCLCLPIDLVKVGETSIDRTHSNTHTCAHLLHSQTRWTHHSFKGFFNSLCISRASIWISS